MNVAVVEPASTYVSPACSKESEISGEAHIVEWIDPGGNDWFSELYRDLTRDSAIKDTASQSESEHWFG